MAVHNGSTVQTYNGRYRKGDMMKRSAYLSWCMLLIASGTLCAGETPSRPQDEPLQVRGVVKSHAWGYDVKRSPGSSELAKTREALCETRPGPKIVHIAKQGVSDAQ
jgi:hypothetical protein